VTFSVIGDAIITPATNPPDTVASQAILTTTALSPGTYVIRAIYSGDRNYAAATSNVPVTVNVQPATTSTTLSTTSVPSGTVLTASVVVTSPGNPPIVGTVSFYDGTTLLGTEPLVDGVASLNIGVLSSGSHVFSAAYSGGGTSSTSGSSITVSTDGPQIVGLSLEGFHQRTTVIILTFNQPLSTAAAQNVANYQLFRPTGHRYAIRSVLYNPATRTVKIVPWVRLPLKSQYLLEVIGSGANGITGANGVALDGTGLDQPGTNFGTQVSWRALGLPKTHQK
jgi:hypothetical protein